jgi:hypothetical protein
MFGYFYHGTIRKYVVAFGTLFNNIYINRVDEDGTNKRFRIPLSYAGREKYIRRIQEFPVLQSDENQPDSAYSYMPRMSFDMVTLSYDASRKRNTMSKVYQHNAETSSYSFNYAEVPYNIQFSLSIMARKMEDGLQVVEQILPYFSPEFTVTLDIGSFARKVDIPITLDSYEQQVDYEGEVDEGTEHRMITWTLNFTMRGYVYGPSKNADVIKKAIVEFFDSSYYGKTAGSGLTNGRMETVVVYATAGTGGIGTGPNSYGYTIKIFGSEAKDSDIFG